MTRTEEQLDEAIRDVGYELWMTSVCAQRLHHAHGADDGVAVNVFLESMLIHTRGLADFLIGKAPGYPTDIRRTDFADEWEPAPRAAVDRIKARSEIIHKHVAHLTWERVSEPKVHWDYTNVASDVVAVADAWSFHVAAESDRRFSVFRPFVFAAARLVQ